MMSISIHRKGFVVYIIYLDWCTEIPRLHVYVNVSWHKKPTAWLGTSASYNYSLIGPC